MPAEPSSRAGRWIHVLARATAGCARHLGWITVAAGAIVLVLGFIAGLPALAVTATAVGPVAISHAVLIIRPTRKSVARPVRRGLSDGVRLLGLGVLIAGLATVGVGIVDQLAPDLRLGGERLSLEVLLVGVFLAEGSYLLGLVRMPGIHLTVLGRLRRALDGVGMGLCGVFVSWMLLFGGDGIRTAGFIAVLISCFAFCCMVVAGLRSAAGRSAALACGGGIALSIAGMTQLVVAVDYHDPANRVIASGVVLLASSVLIRRATSAVIRSTPVLDPVDSHTDFGGYPLFALPLAAALIAWVYHFVQRRGFDPSATSIALAAVVVVTLRGAVASIDARRNADRLAAQEAHFRSLSSGSTDVIMVLNADLLVRWQSPAAARQFGLSDQDVLGRPFLALVHPDDTDRAARYLTVVTEREQPDETGPVESQIRDGFGAWRDIEWKLVDHRAVTAVAAMVVHLRDVGDRKRLQHTLRRAALVDQLTGLPNRRELCNVLAGRANPGVLMVLDLTGVTGIKDTRGHGVGDAVLAEAARRIREGATATDLPVRLDGDRFAVLTGEGAVQAQFLGTRLLTMLAEPYRLPGGTAHLSANAGLAEFTPGTDADEVRRRAELALRQVSRWDRGGAVAWYDESIEVVLQRQLTIEQALSGLLTRTELDLRYQPIIDLRTRQPIGVEASLRWRHPTLGVIPPDEFMAVAERVGLADAIDTWLLDRACRELAGWLSDHHDLWLSLDVSVERLTEPAFVSTVESTVERTMVPASRLVLEVGEPELTVLRSDAARHGSDVDPTADARAEAIMGQMTELRSLGVRVALDHFGTAATSLSRLRVMPVDILKVDRQLFDEPARRSGPAPAIIEVMVRLGRQLGMEVAVQGLETEQDLDMALTAGCHFGQGDVLHPAVPAERLEAYLDSARSQRR